MEQEIHEPAQTAQKNIVIWMTMAILGVVVITVVSLLYMQNKNIQSLEQTVADLSFDECGALSKYKNKTWYSKLAKNTTLTTESLKTIENAPEKTATLQEVSDACFSENGKLLIMLIPGDYAQGPTVYRFNTESFKLEHATLKDNGRGWLASPDEFGKREGNVIHLEGTSGDAGAGSTMYFEYNFINNVVELKKEYSFSSDDPDNGTWKNY